MREKLKAFFCMLFLVVTFPYITMVVLDAKESGKVQGDQPLDGETVLAESSQVQDADKTIDSGEKEALIGILAREISPDCEREALRAQAVIARTNYRAALDYGEEPPAFSTQEEMLQMWGQKKFSENYGKLANAVQDTDSVTIKSRGVYIYAAFHAVSAGNTRNAADVLGNGQMPWLVSVESPADMEAPGYLQVEFMEKKEMVSLLQSAFPQLVLDAEDLPNQFVVVRRDEAGYVMQAKIGEESFDGEEVRKALDLGSSCFYVKEVDGKMRIVTKGQGHGLGLSQYGANEMARQGRSWQEILCYYYKNIEISD